MSNLRSVSNIFCSYKRGCNESSLAAAERIGCMFPHRCSISTSVSKKLHCGGKLRFKNPNHKKGAWFYATFVTDDLASWSWKLRTTLNNIEQPYHVERSMQYGILKMNNIEQPLHWILQYGIMFAKWMNNHSAIFHPKSAMLLHSPPCSASSSRSMIFTARTLSSASRIQFHSCSTNNPNSWHLKTPQIRRSLHP